MKKEQLRLDLTNLISNYLDNIYTELKLRWNQWEKDLTKKEQVEVVGGILSRQISLMTNFGSSLNMWNGDIAPTVLRPMCENYINLAWILKDLESRSQKFIKHGLGQAKLALEHRKKQLEADGIDTSEDMEIKFKENWLNNQRYTFLTEVNIGSWSGISVREMADEAECIDFYNYVYQPFSSSCHNTWEHISIYNLERSDNPLHKNIFTPVVHRIDPDIKYFILGAKYLDKCFKIVDETFKVEENIKSSYDKYLDGFEDIYTKSREKGHNNVHDDHVG
jgi:hypothetical protein